MLVPFHRSTLYVISTNPSIKFLITKQESWIWRFFVTFIMMLKLHHKRPKAFSHSYSHRHDPLTMPHNSSFITKLKNPHNITQWHIRLIKRLTPEVPQTCFVSAYNIDMPNSITHRNRTSISDQQYVVQCGSKNRYRKDMCINNDGTVCSKHDNHSRFTQSRYNVGECTTTWWTFWPFVSKTFIIYMVI